MRRIGFQLLFEMTVFLLLIGLSACNVFEATHTRGASKDPDVLLSDAQSAQISGDYVLAASLYMKVLEANPDDSQARAGYASVILLRDMEIQDVPILVANVYSLDAADISNEFNTNLAGAEGVTVEEYRSNVLNVVSNATYIRGPIHGIDPATGVITTNTNGEPLATLSDGEIAADDRTSLLNYLIAKTIHVGMYVQQKFTVYGNLTSGIDVAEYTNSVSSVNREQFTNSHVKFTNDIMMLSNAYAEMTDVVLSTNENTSVWNLLGVADSYLKILSNDATEGSISSGSYNAASEAVSRVRSAITGLAESITNAASGIKAGFTEIATFRGTAENAARGAGWMPY